jgi:membrane protein implicated in regulation of membrane protease activity
MELLSQINLWHWLILGGALLILELLGAAGYLLWLGMAALCVSAVQAAYPQPWQSQWLLFALLALLFTTLWWRWQRRALRKKDPAAEINQRNQELIGQSATLLEAVVNGHSRIKIGDTSWPVRCETSLPAGSQVTILRIDGIHLLVAPMAQG